MKVAFIAPFAGPLFFPLKSKNDYFGGAEVQIMLLTNYLAEQGHCVKVFVKAPFRCRYMKANGIEIIPFQMRYAGGNKFYLPADMMSLFRALKKADADIYVLKLPRILLPFVGFFTALRKRRLVFWLTIDRDVNLKDVQGMGGSSANRIYRFGLRFIHHVIAQSNYQLNKCRFIGLDATYIPSLVKMGSSQWTYLKSNPPIVLWVGSNEQRKHPEVFLEMARMLPEIQFKMIVSERNRARANELRSLCELILNLEYLGPVAYQDMDEHYSKASLFISTSELEGVPNTFLQSWANGTPVVSLSVDPDGVIEKKRLGFCAKCDLDLLVNRIKSLINNRELCIEMGHNARAHIAETHSIETVGPKYVDVFQKILFP